MKKRIIILLDIITILILLIQFESMAEMVIEQFGGNYISRFKILNYLHLYPCYGMVNLIEHYGYKLFGFHTIPPHTIFEFIIFLLNQYVVVVKVKDIMKKTHAFKHKWLICINLLYIVLRCICYHFWLPMALSV